MNDFILSAKEDARQWCQGKVWQPRLLVLLYMGYIFIKHVSDFYALRHPGFLPYSSLIGALNFGIHEFGHVLFTPLGQFMHFLGGSLFQCMVPVIGMVMFYRQRDYFAIFFAFGWLSTNFFYVADYVRDARTEFIPLVSPFGPHAMHDWKYLLGNLHMLSWDKTFGFLLRGMGILSMFVCLAGGAWILWEMFRSSGKDSQKSARSASEKSV